MEKIDVNGANTHPVWAWAKKETKSGDVGWNFAAKFIVRFHAATNHAATASHCFSSA